MTPQRLSASQAERFMACHASANLDLAIPNWVPPVKDPLKDNAANRGTRMHELFAQVMELPTRDAENFSRAVQYVADVRRLRRFTVLIEQQVHAQWLISRPGTTADLVLFVADELHVIDLKTGATPVEAVENQQLLFYAAAYGELAPKARGAHLHIVQPWADNIDSWFAPAARIQRFMAESLLAEQSINGGDTAFMPGDHCLFCPANPKSRAAKGHPFCPALMQMHYPMAVDEDAILNEE